jgi:hypothetical protein
MWLRSRSEAAHHALDARDAAFAARPCGNPVRGTNSLLALFCLQTAHSRYPEASLRRCQQAHQPKPCHFAKMFPEAVPGPNCFMPSRVFMQLGPKVTCRYSHLRVGRVTGGCRSTLHRRRGDRRPCSRSGGRVCACTRSLSASHPRIRLVRKQRGSAFFAVQVVRVMHVHGERQAACRSWSLRFMRGQALAYGCMLR